MVDIDIRKLKKIDGNIYELHRVNKVDITRYKEDCKVHISSIDQKIEELEYQRKAFENEIEIVNTLLKRSE